MSATTTPKPTAQHTPGPWSVQPLHTSDSCDIFSPDHRENIATVWDLGTLAKSCPADARLIAAAPELLEALQGITELADHDVESTLLDLSERLLEITRTARAAIAKAVQP